ncbi:Non-specific lipid transfer protein GPI-anchored 2 [Linum grandiflorum]
MHHQSTIVMVTAIAIVMLSVGGSAQMMSPGAAPESSSAPSPGGVDCFTQLLNLSDCLTYVESGSKLTKPDKPCCPELAGLVESNPICLCQLLTVNASSYGFDIDKNRAFGLPSVCSVSTPPVNLCSVINGSPVGAPMPSQGGGMSGAAGPGGAMPMSPSPSPASGGGSNGGPSSRSSPTANYPIQLSTQLILTTTICFLLLLSSSH